jgi:short-subunit dehydrogenase
MNIIILGGGTPNKFGHDFALKARGEGHKVVIFSHKLNGLNDPDQHVINYEDLNKTKLIFQAALQDISKIDLIIFNANGFSYPYVSRDPFSNIDPIEYHKSINLHAIVPHLLLGESINKMDEGSKVVYMTTGLAYNLVRSEYHQHYGYGGHKSFMTHLMLGFATNRTKNITFSIFSPHFPYEDREKYKKVFENCYQWILSHDDSANGKIMAMWDENRSPFQLYFDYSDRPYR